jgi:hypothetical protein
MSQIDFELGAIAHHCLQVYKKLGKNYYDGLPPDGDDAPDGRLLQLHRSELRHIQGAERRFLEAGVFAVQGVLRQHGHRRPLPQYKFREELRNYFDEFKDRAEVDGEIMRSYYVGFNADKYKAPLKNDVTSFKLVLDQTSSLFDEVFASCPLRAQQTDRGTPKTAWSRVKTKLADIDTGNTHYVKVPRTIL